MKSHAMNAIAKKVILMDPFPARGHVTAFYNFAGWLSENGYKIVFVGFIEPQQVFLGEDYEFYRIDPFIIVPATFEIQTKGYLSFLLDNIYKSRSKRIVERFKQPSTRYLEIIRIVKPDLILLDNHYACKAIFYMKLKVKVLLVSTMIIPKKASGIPPFQSTFVPSHSLRSHLYVNYLWMRNRIIRKTSSCAVDLVSFGKSDRSILRKIFNDVPYTLDISGCFGVGIKELPVVATYPKSFDFRRDLSSDRIFHFGELVKMKTNVIDDPRLLEVLRNTSERKLIYCSLGTITFHDIKICEVFFKRMIAVACENPQYYFFLNVGKHYGVNQLPSSPKNISIFNHVPQRALLNRVDVMINHGGINSIKECLDAHIPMIVYPLSLDWDQPGCAARVAYHKIGVIGNIRKDKATIISAKINFLMGHLEEYKNNIRKLNSEINRINKLENVKILALVEGLVNGK